MDHLREECQEKKEDGIYGTGKPIKSGKRIAESWIQENIFVIGAMVIF